MSTDESSTIQSQLKSLLDEVKSQREEISSLRNDVQGSAVNVSNEVKQLRKDRDIKWNHLGNKIQFEFNSELQELYSQADWALQHGKVDYAQELLKESHEKVRKRNKLIRIADSSEGGWETVKQYETNPVASDSDDETRINKAESRAIKKQKTKLGKQKSRNATSTYAPGYNQHLGSVGYSSGFSNMPGVQRMPFGGGSSSFRGFPRNMGQRFANPGYSGPGSCFACGEFSHFRRDCPYTAASRPSSSQPETKK